MKLLSMNKKRGAEFLKDYDDILDVKDLSSIFGVSTKTIYKFLEKEKIDYIVVGRKICVPKIKILDLINKGESS